MSDSPKALNKWWVCGTPQGWRISKEQKRRQLRYVHRTLLVGCQTAKTTPTSPAHYLLPETQEENDALLPGGVKGMLPLWVRPTRKKYARACTVLQRGPLYYTKLSGHLTSSPPKSGTPEVATNFISTFSFYPRSPGRHPLSPSHCIDEETEAPRW